LQPLFVCCVKTAQFNKTVNVQLQGQRVNDKVSKDEEYHVHEAGCSLLN